MTDGCSKKKFPTTFGGWKMLSNSDSMVVSGSRKRW